MKMTINVNNDKVRVTANGGNVVDSMVALAGLYSQTLATIKSHKVPMPPGMIEMLPGMTTMITFLDDGFRNEHDNT